MSIPRMFIKFVVCLEAFYISKGYLVEDRIDKREIRKALNSWDEIVKINLYPLAEYYIDICLETTIPCDIVKKEDIDNNTSIFTYYMAKRGVSDNCESNYRFFCLIRYHTASNDVCESFAVFNLIFTHYFKSSKSFKLEDKTLEIYSNILISRIIIAFRGSNFLEQALSNLLTGIRHTERYRPLFFEKVDFVKNLFLKIQEIANSYHFGATKIRKVLDFLKDYYVTSVYKGGVFPKDNRKVLKIIMKDDIKRKEMINSIYKMLTDFLLIYKVMIYGEAVYQKSLYVNHSHLKNKLTIRKCYSIKLPPCCYVDTSYLLNKIDFKTFKNEEIKVETFFLKRKIIFLMRETDLDRLISIHLDFKAENGEFIDKEIKLNKKHLI